MRHRRPKRPQPGFLSPKQASADFNLSEKPVRKSIKSGEIEPMRVPLDRSGAAYRTFGPGLAAQRDRNAVELRAALGTALEAMPKAMTEGTATTGPSA